MRISAILAMISLRRWMSPTSAKGSNSSSIECVAMLAKVSQLDRLVT
jgi:hypothetical protein